MGVISHFQVHFFIVLSSKQLVACRWNATDAIIFFIFLAFLRFLVAFFIIFSTICFRRTTKAIVEKKTSSWRWPSKIALEHVANAIGGAFILCNWNTASTRLLVVFLGVYSVHFYSIRYAWNVFIFNIILCTYTVSQREIAFRHLIHTQWTNTFSFVHVSKLSICSSAVCWPPVIIGTYFATPHCFLIVWNYICVADSVQVNVLIQPYIQEAISDFNNTEVNLISQYTWCTFSGHILKISVMNL